MNQTVRQMSSCATGAGAFLLLYFSLGAAPILLGCDAVAGALAGLSVWHLWPLISGDIELPTDPNSEPTVENIEAKLPELQRLQGRLTDTGLREKVQKICDLAGQVLNYLKENRATSPPEAPILLMKNIESTTATVNQYLLLPKVYDETTANFSRVLDSAGGALEGLFDTLARKDADGFASACEVVEQTLKALNTLLPSGGKNNG